ncbi:MAG TPA: VWA domain-containing protein [Pyrinomonadaceae bacterium]|nr:VWA domain-containing protein [Pyrinomonadaceae bacterium]
MKRIKLLLALLLATAVLSQTSAARQTAPTQQQPPAQADDDEVIRISSDLVQTSVVVTDKNDRIVNDLKLDDFEVYENGKKQDLKFMEFVSVEGERRTEGSREGLGGRLPESARIERELTARDVRRVVAFVVDDLSISHNDMVTVRQTLGDFIDNKMQRGDLVAIIRTAGGKGLLEQLTSDKETLRRAVRQLRSIAAANPFASVAENSTGVSLADLIGSSGLGANAENIGDIGVESATSAVEESTRISRTLVSLSVTQNVVESLRDIPGRKSLVLLSGGLPGFGGAGGRNAISADGAPIMLPSGGGAGLGSYLNTVLKLLADDAVRAGVVINTMDPRGLNAARGVAGFEETPARSGLMGGDPNFARGGSEMDTLGYPLDGAAEHLSLRLLSDTTGGVAVVNTNDMKLGLDKVLARSRGYYVLAYSPAERFDNKFRKLDIKVKRDGLRLYKYSGYLAREEKPAAPRTKEQEIMAAARAPLARRDVDVTANLSMRMTPPKGAALDINLLIDPKTLGIEESGGKYPFSFDVVGFVIDERGKTRGGFSQTVSGALTPESYRKAEDTGLTYSTNTQLPPGYYQLRVVVREAAGGRLGTVSRYVEVPDLSKGRLALSSIFLHAVDLSGAAQPVPLAAVRQLSRKQDLRYSAIVYNAKLEAGKPRLLTQTIVSRDERIIYRSPERPATPRGNDPSQLVVVEQIGLGKLSPGHYLLTFMVTDALSDKKEPLTRSIDFTVVD